MAIDWTCGSGRISLSIEREDAVTCAHPGPNDGDIEDLLQKPYIQEQVAGWSPEDLRATLKDFGAWDEQELQDHEANVRRMLWSACWDIIDDGVD